jgi:hypothetical protein
MITEQKTFVGWYNAATLQDALDAELNEGWRVDYSSTEFKLDTSWKKTEDGKIIHIPIFYFCILTRTTNPLADLAL